MVSRRVRVFVFSLMGVFVLCGLTGAEAWPLTGWKLFSQVRHETQPGWEAVAVNAGGGEVGIDFADLGRGYRGALSMMQSFPRSTPVERELVCRAWASAVRQHGSTDVVFVRVYRTVLAVDAPGRPLERALVHECR